MAEKQPVVKRMTCTGSPQLTRHFPWGPRVLVKNEQNGKELELVINDRGPFVAGPYH